MTGEGVTVEGRPDVLPPQAPDALWDDWTIRRDESARQRLVTHYGGFARILAARAFSNRFSLELEFDDYLQFAMLGLLEAVDRFDPARGVPFEAYASRRINGAVLSGVETLSEKQAQISARSQARKDRARSLARDGAPDAGPPADPLQRLADIAVGLALGVMLEGATVYVNGDPSDSAGTPYDRVEIAELRARLRRLVDQLPEQERRVLHHHYYQQVPFDEIAREAGLTKGRISQIHHAALRRLRQLSAGDDNVLLVT